MPSGLAAQSTYDHPLTTLPNADRSDLGIFYPFVGHAWHIAVIEVDVETGTFEFLRYAAVHDAGTIVNPRTLDGQVIGGTVQGLGTAIYEEILYDELGRVGNPSFEPARLPVVDGRSDDHGRPSGDAIAVYGVRDQRCRRGRPDAHTGDHERHDRGRVVTLRRHGDVSSDLGRADRQWAADGGGG